MTDAALTAEPGGLHAVYEWLGEWFSAQPSRRHRRHTDDPDLVAELLENAARRT